MGCGASTATVAMCTGEVSNPREAAFGLVVAICPGQLGPGRMVQLHHAVHGPLVKSRSRSANRQSTHVWEVAVPLGVQPGEQLRIALCQEGTNRYARFERAAAAPGGQVMQITLPPDYARDGQPLTVQTPAGTVISVSPPPDAVGGQTFTVQY